MTDELQGGLHAKGKKQLLEWVNSLLEADFTQVEQLAGGAAYCQMMDALYPGSIALSKVKFEPSATWEYVHNFKLLQKAFEKQKIEKHIDITTLVRAKYQDNLEFLQWMKTFFDDRGKRDTKYEAKKRREEAMRPVIAKNANLKRRASSIVNARNAALRDPRRSSVAVSRLSSKPADKKRKDQMEEDKEDGAEDTENNKENELPNTNMNEENAEEDLGEEKEEIESEKVVFVAPKKQPTQQPKKRLAKRKNKLQQGVSKASIHSSSSSNQQKEETSNDEETEERPTKEEEEEEEEGAAAPQQPKQTMEVVERENMMTSEQTTTTSAIPRPRKPRHSLYLRSAAEAAIQLHNPLPALSTPTKIPLPKTSKRASLPSSVALSFSSSSSSSPTASPRRALSPAAAMASAETRIPLPSSFTFSASSLSPSASPMRKAANNSNANKTNETKTEVIKQQLEELRLEDGDDLLSSDELSEAVPSEVETEDSANEVEEDDEKVPSSGVGEEEQEVEEEKQEEEEEAEKAQAKEKYTVAPSKKRQQIPPTTKSTIGSQASSSQRRGAPISTLKRGRGSTTALPKAQNVKRVRASIATPQQRKSLLVTNKQKDATTTTNTSGKQAIRRTADFGIRARKVGSDLVLLLEDMEKENQMLYNKLQQVEQLCNNPSSFYPSAESLESTSGTGQGSLLIASLRDILYS